jgi:hypothetical protein
MMKIPRKMKKQFKKDNGWFSSDLWIKQGYTPVSIYCIMSCACGKIFKHDIPRIRFANHYEKSPGYFEDCIIMTLNGKILSDEKLNISKGDIDTLRKWVVQYKQILLRHFRLKTSSCELYEELKR